jgi:electron transport complex protein RnfG
MREFIQLAGILTLISVLSAWGLSYTYTITKPIIEVNRVKRQVEAIAAVLPPFDNQPEKDKKTIAGTREGTMVFYIGKKNGRVTGVAFRAFTKGYHGQISMMVGVNPQGKIYGIDILDQSETPGLGAKISQKSFLQQFKGKDLENSRWAVKKMKGDFDQVTAATISSRAMIDGVQEGLSIYQKNAGQILKE